MEEEVDQDAQQGRCQADKGRCLLEAQMQRKRNKRMGSKTRRRVEQRECRERITQRMSEVGVREYKQDREDLEIEP